MPERRTTLTPQSTHGQLAAALSALRVEHGIAADYPAAALAEAEAAAHRGPADPAPLDLRDVPFVTLDPLGSRDLDQAFHLARADEGWVVRYAIADVPAFVEPGGPLDLEARRRGQTLYLPDGAVPLHPQVLSEAAVSLLPDADRTAYVWTVELAPDGELRGARVDRALVRSRAQLDYVSAQAEIDAGNHLAPGHPLALLPEIGAIRIAQERARGGASLNMPDEEIVRDETGYRIERRFPLAVEEWNAQLSLLTGIAAGEMMLAGRIGILRTMPPPSAEARDEFRARVAALGQPWAPTLAYGEYLRQLDAGRPETAAVLQAAAALFRGAGYAVFDGDLPEQPEQAAIAAPYAHVTAPLRRLVDRWGLVICEALCAGREVPEWARASLPELPALMQASNSRTGQITAAALDRVEAALLRDRAGEVFDAVVVDRKNAHARIQITDPAITAQLPAGKTRDTGEPGDAAIEIELPAGALTRVKVISADITTGAIVLKASV